MSTNLLNQSQASDLAVYHSLSPAESAAEAAVIAATVAHFASFSGSQRDAYDALIARTPIDPSVTLQAVKEPGVGGWWVRPRLAAADRQIMFVHGGAYMLGTATAYRGFVSQIVARTGVAAFVPDYPLSPEQPFPAAQNAVEAAYLWLLEQGTGKVALIGDSAGGGLVLSLLGRGTNDRIASVAVFSPWTDLGLTGSTFRSPDIHDPIFQPEVLATAASLHLAGTNPHDGRASPLYAVFSQLPPLLIQAGSDELLLDDSRRYAAAAAERGGPVTLEIYDGLHHGFQFSAAELPTASSAVDRVATFLANHWPRA